MSLKDLLLHLRLHWQVLLSPLFLWGFLLSGGRISLRVWVVFFIFHVLFYGGATALNSYYDQDEGPIGGLWNPPKATRDLLVFSVAVQMMGLVLVFFISRPLFGLSLVMGAIGTGYSHPAIRLKSRPWTSLLAVSIFQGMGGTAAGWLSGVEDWTTLLSMKALLTMLSASVILTGFYPLTQIYQREEDRRHGDITFAVRWGERCFPVAIACMACAAVLMGVLVWRYMGHLEAVVMAGGIAVLAGLIALWWQRYDDGDVRANYLRMMRLGYVMTGGFLSFICWQLVSR